MERGGLHPAAAVLWGGLIAGVLDLGAVFAFWSAHDVAPDVILRSIATSVMGSAAHQGGAQAAAVGLALHFFVSFVFAAGYVLVALRLLVLRRRPILFGLLYGALAYVIMTFLVVPLSLADFGWTWDRPPPPVNLAVSIAIHLFLFGAPIALAASRMRDRS